QCSGAFCRTPGNIPPFFLLLVSDCFKAPFPTIRWVFGHPLWSSPPPGRAWQGSTASYPETRFPGAGDGNEEACPLVPGGLAGENREQTHAVNSVPPRGGRSRFADDQRHGRSQRLD